MKKTKLLFLIILVLAMAASAVPAFSSGITPFSFRNGICFGMSADQLIQTEEANGQVAQDNWTASDMDPPLSILVADSKVKVSKYEANVGYFLSNGRMVVAAYDFIGVTANVYSDITAAVSAVYGPAQDATPEEFSQLLTRLSGNASQVDFSQYSALIWKLDNVTICQYSYDTDCFGVIYFDPDWSDPVIDTTGI